VSVEVRYQSITQAGEEHAPALYLDEGAVRLALLECRALQGAAFQLGRGRGGGVHGPRVGGFDALGESLELPGGAPSHTGDATEG